MHTMEDCVCAHTLTHTHTSCLGMSYLVDCSLTGCPTLAMVAMPEACAHIPVFPGCQMLIRGLIKAGWCSKEAMLYNYHYALGTAVPLVARLLAV